MFEDKADNLENHMSNIRKVRGDVPEDSLVAFDNITVAGDTVVHALRVASAIKNVVDYFRKPQIEVSENENKQNT